MNDNKDIEQDYVESVSAVGKEFFSEYLSNLSRKRQTNLLITAVVTILLAFTLVTPVEGTFAGIKFGFPDVKIIPVVSGSICLYFLTTYLIGVWQDRQYFTYQQLPFRKTLASMNSRLVQTKHDEIQAKLKQKKERHERASQATSEMKKRHAAEMEELKQQGKRIDELVQFNSRYLDEFIKFKIDQLEIGQPDDLNRAFDDLREEIAKRSYLARLNLISQTYTKYDNLKRLNLFIEVVFPATLATFAIGSVVWAVFLK